MVYTVKEVAELLKCDTETVRRRLASKEWKGFKVGNDWRITAEEIERIKSCGDE